MDWHVSRKNTVYPVIFAVISFQTAKIEFNKIISFIIFYKKRFKLENNDIRILKKIQIFSIFANFVIREKGRNNIMFFVI